MLYKLSNDFENVGSYPQVTEVIWNSKVDDFWRANEFYNPALNGMVPAPTPLIRPRAKVTDALSVVSTSRFLVVNEKLLHYLQSVRNDGLRIIPTTAVKKGISYPYWLVTIDTVHDDYVKYQECQFLMRKGMFEEYEDISISSEKQYLNLMAGLHPHAKIKTQKVVLNTANIQQDIFKLPVVSTIRFCVTEKFRQGVEEAKITGLRFEPLPDFVHV